MRKYWEIILTSWENGFVYRTSLFFWRLRQFLGTLMALTIWNVLFASRDAILTYNREQMITYIFLVTFLQSALLTTALHGLANDIYSGKLSHLLIKPVNIFGYLAAVDIADKAKNMIFALIEMGILALIFTPVIPLPTLINAIAFVSTTVLGMALYFIIILLFGSFGFWSPETWAPRFLFFMFLDFTAGKLFPLDILPQVVQRIIYLTPFPYFSYIQVQLFLGRLDPTQAVTSIATLCAWVIGLGVLVYWVWKQGLKNYSAAGI